MMEFQDSNGRFIKGMKHGSLSNETKKKMSLAQTGRKFSAEHIRKLSESHKGLPSPNKGKHASVETLKKLHDSHLGQIPWMKGKTHSIKSKLLIGFKSKGNKYRLGKYHSKETLEKLRVSHLGQLGFWKGKHLYKEAVEKMIKSKTGIPQPQAQRDKIKETWNRPEYKLLARERRKKQVFPIKDTQIEIKIQSYLKQLNIEFVTHKYLGIEHDYQTDTFIPSLNLVIECDGDYWHANPVIYTNPNAWQSKQIAKDNIRTRELKEKGYSILRMWEREIKHLSLNDFKIKLDKYQKQGRFK